MIINITHIPSNWVITDRPKYGQRYSELFDILGRFSKVMFQHSIDKMSFNWALSLNI